MNVYTGTNCLNGKIELSIAFGEPAIKIDVEEAEYLIERLKTCISIIKHFKETKQGIFKDEV